MASEASSLLSFYNFKLLNFPETPKVFPEAENFHRKYYFRQNIQTNLETAENLLIYHSTKVFPYSPVHVHLSSSFAISTNLNRTKAGEINATESYRTAFESLHFTNFLVYFVLFFASVTSNFTTENKREKLTEAFLIPSGDEAPSSVIFLVFDPFSMQKLSQFFQRNLKTFPFHCNILTLFKDQLYSTSLIKDKGYLTKPLSGSFVKNRNINLAQTSLLVFAAPKVHDCIEISHNPSYYFNTCIIKVIKEQLNVTFQYTTMKALEEFKTSPSSGELPPPLDFGMNVIFNGELCDAFNFNRTTKFNTLDRWVISNPSFRSFPYSYVTVGYHLANGMTAITKPYQVKTWVCIIVTSVLFPICVTFLLRLENKFIRSCKVNFIDLAFITFAGALSQCDEHSSRVITNSRLVGYLWIIWNFVSIIILNAYDGQFYSFLASELKLSAPGSLEDLVTSGISSVTFNVIWLTPQNENGDGSLKRGSAFKDVILKDVFTSGKTFPNYFPLLNESLSSYLLVKPVESMADAMVDIIQKNKPFSEKIFAFIDFQDTIALLRNLISHIDGRTVSKAKDAENFVMRYASLTRRSYVTPLVHKIFSDLFESGHLLLWNKYHQRKMGKRTLAILNEWLKNGLRQLKKGNFLSYHYGSAERDDITNFTADPTPIPWSLIRNVVHLALILLGVAVMVLVLEIVVFWEMTMLRKYLH